MEPLGWRLMRNCLMTYRYLKAVRFYGPEVVLNVLELAVVRIRISKIIIGIFWECWPAQPWGSSAIPLPYLLPVTAATTP